MRYRVLGALLVAFVSVHGMAWANGPSGSTEDKKNTVKCKGGTNVPGGGMFVYLGPNGIESCTQSGPGLHGRIIASSDGGGYFSADGTKDNPSQLQGFFRLQPGAPPKTCTSTPKNQDATKPCP